MPLAVTHILIVIILLDLIRHYVVGKNKFPKYLLVIGGIAGLGPDIDVVLGWILSLVNGFTIDVHGAFTHSLFFVIIFFAVGLIRNYQEDKKGAKILYVIAFGWLMHLILDCTFGGVDKAFLFPIPLAANFCPQLWFAKFTASIDAILLVLWLVHEEVQNNIKKYFL